MVTYEQKRKQWIECLAGEDRHSILNQIRDLIWDAGSFRIINEARSIACQDESGRIRVSGLLHGLLNRCFFDSQTIAIRRLTEDHKWGLQGCKSTYSLASILSDMEQYRHVMTRRDVFAVEGLEYYVDVVRRRRAEFLRSQRASGTSKTFFIPEELCLRRPEARHRSFDELAGVDEHERRPEDTPRSDVFEALKKRLKDTSSSLKTYVDKFIAHAATPESRMMCSADNIDPTLNSLWHAHEVVCNVFAFLVGPVLNHTRIAWDILAPFGFLEHLEQPLIEADRLPELQRIWDEFVKQCNTWNQWGWQDFNSEMNTPPDIPAK